MKRGLRIALVLWAGLLLAVGAFAAQAADGRSVDRLFHQRGLIYFWALNDECSDEKMDRLIDAFVQGGAAAVCLHPRPGLLKPYGGEAWFEFVRRTVDRCAERGLDVWLYDEDPYPSGNVGGRMTMEHPEFQAMESLACSGLDFTAEQAAGILRWQLTMGVTTPVVHCAYNSVAGLRLTEAPPDFGPESSRWPGMVALGRELADLQPIVRDARQIAPVALLWPIRSFAALPPAEFTADSPLRNELVRLVQRCLDH